MSENNMLAERAKKILDLLEQATRQMPKPMSHRIIDDYGKDPYLILISCLLSLRARDVMTYPVSKELFGYARSPEQMVHLSLSTIEKIIKPIGFYKRKARIIQHVSQQLITDFSGKVPQTEDELLSINGVGRKTAHLVLSMAFDVPAIVVDVHVHRVSNRLGLVRTRTPYETEIALKKIIPQERWRSVNSLFVTWGQNICVPISPLCSRCVLYDLCPRIGVTKHR